ncbi:hypothetical protein C8R47DRAFT_1312757 [Mycena vitilis]|nr:hypothetical protein C8R47DRAFT_1312757 [Mycena vitilis]
MDSSESSSSSSSTDQPNGYVWAIVCPSAQDSVAYLESALATSAAADLKCGEHLALVKIESEAVAEWDDTVLAFLVQPSDYALPDTYLPILPCQVGSREPLVPGFDWPFVHSVVDTSRKFIFDPVVIPSEGPRRVISDAASCLFTTIHREDAGKKLEGELAKRSAEREAAGVDHDAQWTTFSRKSTVANIVPGDFFPPLFISARIRYNIESLRGVLPAGRCFDEVREIQRLRAQFSQTERTILWALGHAPCASGNTFREEPAEEFQNPALFDLCDSLERPRSPSRSAVPLSAAPEEQDDDAILGDRWLHRITPVTVPRTPILQPHALEVIYFDVFGTLILPSRIRRREFSRRSNLSFLVFARHEALAFYFEVESDLKKRAPELRYVQVLARTYTDMAMRLGLSSTADESFVFACSLFRWPLFDDAVHTLQALRSFIPILVGIVDMDFEGLGNTAAFRQLKPYFERVFSWDQFHAYRPDPPAIYPPLMCPSFGIPQSHRCFLSSAPFRDLEPACHADIPAIWLRRPGTLAANLPTSNAPFVWRICERLPDVVSAILEEKGAPRGLIPTHSFYP